jgi:hypothetical protein
MNDIFSPEPGLDITVTRARQRYFRVSVNRHLATNERMVPPVRFTPTNLASQRIQAAGLVPQFTGPTGLNAFVFTQTPTGGTIVAVGSTVRMTTRKGPTP